MSPPEDLAKKMWFYAFSTLLNSEVDPDYIHWNDGNYFFGRSSLSDETIYKIQRFKSNIVREIYLQWKFYHRVQRDQNITMKNSTCFC